MIRSRKNKCLPNADTPRRGEIYDELCMFLETYCKDGRWYMVEMIDFIEDREDKAVEAYKATNRKNQLVQETAKDLEIQRLWGALKEALTNADLIAPDFDRLIELEKMFTTPSPDLGSVLKGAVVALQLLEYWDQTCGVDIDKRLVEWGKSLPEHTRTILEQIGRDHA